MQYGVSRQAATAKRRSFVSSAFLKRKAISTQTLQPLIWLRAGDKAERPRRHAGIFAETDAEHQVAMLTVTSADFLRQYCDEQQRINVTKEGKKVNKYHIAQVNIGRIKAPLDHPMMAGFMGRLDEINALADNSPGFVWRLQTGEGNATYFRPYDHDYRILLNMSVWETVEALEIMSIAWHMPNYSGNGRSGSKSLPACTLRYGGRQPATSPALTKQKAHRLSGTTRFNRVCFYVQNHLSARGAVSRGIDWSSFLPCPAV